METAEGPEPCAVLASRGAGDQAAAAIEGANARLAEFQRVRRWVLWPEPDLPRTSTGKVRRKAVEAWVQRIQSAASAAGNGTAHHNGTKAFGASQDWLLGLIGQISGEPHPGVGDELHLTEDLHLDSLGRVQLAAAIEDRLGIVSEDGMLDRVETLGELRRLVAGEVEGERAAPSYAARSPRSDKDQARAIASPDRNVEGEEPAIMGERAPDAFTRRRHIYPRWPWFAPVQWVRMAFVEAVMRPLVWLLAAPRVVVADGLKPEALAEDGPMLIIANHVTSLRRAAD